MHAGLENLGRGIGVRANWSSSAPQLTSASSLLSPSTVVTAGPVASSGGTVQVSTLPDLRAAVLAAGVSRIVLRGPIALDGSPILVAGRGRVLSIAADPASCPDGPSPAANCTLDARSLSRHFDVRAGAQLRLSGLALLNGAAIAARSADGGPALQGGSVLVNGGALTAVSCLFFNMTAVGDGGAVLALAGSSVDFENCASPGPLSRINLLSMVLSLKDFASTACRAASPSPRTGTFIGGSSVAGSGGAVAAVFSSNATFRSTSFQNCSAQGGGAAAALYASSLSVLDGSTVLGSTAEIGGAFIAWNNSVATVANATVRNCRRAPIFSLLIPQPTIAARSSSLDATPCHLWLRSRDLMTLRSRYISVSRSSSGISAGLSVKWFSAGTVSDSLFDGLDSAIDGGCIHAWRGANLTAERSRFSRCSTQGQGGGASGARGRSPPPHTCPVINGPESCFAFADTFGVVAALLRSVVCEPPHRQQLVPQLLVRLGRRRRFALARSRALGGVAV